MRSIYGAWQANARVNGELLEHLADEMLNAQTPGGGYTVAQHLAEMTEAKKAWGSRLDESLETLPDLFDTTADAFIAEEDLTRIRDVMTRTESAVLGVAQKEPGGTKGRLPHATAEALLVHLMVHDAHHRGQILLALKTSGYALPEEDRLWGPWRGE